MVFLGVGSLPFSKEDHKKEESLPTPSALTSLSSSEKLSAQEEV
jgi:hypothetical protein